MRRACLIIRIVDLVKAVNAWVRQCFNLLRQEEMCKDSLDSLVKIFFFQIQKVRIIIGRAILHLLGGRLNR